MNVADECEYNREDCYFYSCNTAQTPNARSFGNPAYFVAHTSQMTRPVKALCVLAEDMLLKRDAEQ